MSTTRKLTGNTKLRRGFWKKLVLQVEVRETGTEIAYAEDSDDDDTEVKVDRTFWRDAKKCDICAGKLESLSFQSLDQAMCLT